MNIQSYTSQCVSYGTTLYQDNYNIDGITPSPPILPVTVNLTNSIYTIIIGNFYITYDSIIPSITQSDGLSVVYSNNTISISLLNNGENYVSGDTYTINLSLCYTVNFTRLLTFVGEYTAKNFYTCEEYIKYTVQSNNVGTDLSTCLYSINGNKNVQQKIGGIYKYIKGIKNNCRERVYDIWIQSTNNIELPIVFFEFLLQNIYFYAVLKCILCQLLYGEYNNKYLCNSYNKKIYYDLKNSKYSGYLYYFSNCESPFFGLDIYFV